MKRVALLLAVVIVMGSAAGAAFQRRGGGGQFRRGPSVPANPRYDGAWMFCRIMFRNASNGDGAGWSVDWPRADENLSMRFSELTRTSVSRSATGEFNHVVISLTDAAPLSHCPFIMMTEPGGAFFDDAEAAGLKTYLDKGGFLWADDFWGDYAFEHWINELRKALPSSDYPLMDVPRDVVHVRVAGVARELDELLARDPVDRLLVWHRRRHVGTRTRQRDAARASHLRPRRKHPRRDDAQHRLRRCVRA